MLLDTRQVAEAEHHAKLRETVISPEAWRLLSKECRGEPRGGEGCVLLQGLAPGRPDPGMHGVAPELRTALVCAAACWTCRLGRQRCNSPPQLPTTVPGLRRWWLQGCFARSRGAAEPLADASQLLLCLDDSCRQRRSRPCPAFDRC